MLWVTLCYQITGLYNIMQPFVSVEQLRSSEWAAPLLPSWQCPTPPNSKLIQKWTKRLDIGAHPKLCTTLRPNKIQADKICCKIGRLNTGVFGDWLAFGARLDWANRRSAIFWRFLCFIFSSSGFVAWPEGEIIHSCSAALNGHTGEVKGRPSGKAETQ